MVLTSQGHLGEESLSLALGSAQANCVVPILQSFQGLTDTHRYPCPPPLLTALYRRDSRQNTHTPHTPPLRSLGLLTTLPNPQLNKGDFNLRSLGLGF